MEYERFDVVEEEDPLLCEVQLRERRLVTMWRERKKFRTASEVEHGVGGGRCTDHHAPLFGAITPWRVKSKRPTITQSRDY